MALVTETSSNLSTNNQYIKYRIIVTENSINTTNNTSNVNVKVQVWRTNTGYTTYGTGTCYCTINGTQYSASITTSQKFTYNSYTQVFSKTLDIPHNSDGSKTLAVTSYINHARFSSTSQGFNVTLTNIPRQANINSAPNFTDEQNPTITYTNSAGSAVSSLQACISLTGSNDDIEYRDISKTGTSYTFNLTTAERNVLRNATTTSNTRSVIFYIKTVIGGNTYYSTLTRTLTIVNATPTVGSFTYQDTNSTTTAITENNQLIIQSNSTLVFTLGTATALKGASISSYKVNFNAVNYTLTSAGTITINNPNVSSDTSAVLTVTDTRGNTANLTITVQVLAWSLPYALITAQRQQNFYSETNILVDGKYSSLNNKNTLTIQFQYKKVTDETYSALETITNNTQFTETLDNLYQWNLRFILTDELGSTTYNLTLDRGLPIAFYDILRKSFGVNCFPQNENSLESDNLQIDDKIYIGSQVLYENSVTLSTATTQSILGSYDYNLIDGIFNGITIPDGWVRAYRLTCQVTTGGNNLASVCINNIYSNTANTWSNNTMRKLVSTRIFKESEIELETTYNYSKLGTNLKYINNGNYNAIYYNPTIHGYLVKASTNLSSASIASDEETEAAT